MNGIGLGTGGVVLVIAAAMGFSADRARADHHGWGRSRTVVYVNHDYDVRVVPRVRYVECVWSQPVVYRFGYRHHHLHAPRYVSYGYNSVVYGRHHARSRIGRFFHRSRHGLRSLRHAFRHGRYYYH